MPQLVFNLPKLVLLQEHPELTNPAGKAFALNWALPEPAAGAAGRNPGAKISAVAEVPMQVLDIARWAPALVTPRRLVEKP